MKPVTRQLPCKLTEEEITARGCHLAEVEREIEKKEDEKQRHAKALGDEIKEMRSRTRLIAQEISTRTTYRDVEITEQKVGVHMETVRLDTGEVIETRPLTAEERQVTSDEIVHLDARRQGGQ